MGWRPAMMGMWMRAMVVIRCAASSVVATTVWMKVKPATTATTMRVTVAIQNVVWSDVATGARIRVKPAMTATVWIRMTAPMPVNGRGAGMGFAARIGRLKIVITKPAMTETSPTMMVV